MNNNFNLVSSVLMFFVLCGWRVKSSADINYFSLVLQNVDSLVSETFATNLDFLGAANRLFVIFCEGDFSKQECCLLGHFLYYMKFNKFVHKDDKLDFDSSYE